MKVINGDLLKAFSDGEVDVIIHQVNCRGGMGAGIAKSIKKLWPAHFADYLEYISNCSGPGSHLLGDFVETSIGDQSIIGVFGQNHYGPNKRQTNYAALINGILDSTRSLNSTTRIGIPLIGCGLAGGDWSFVGQAIEDIEAMTGIEFTLYLI